MEFNSSVQQYQQQSIKFETTKTLKLESQDIKAQNKHNKNLQDIINDKPNFNDKKNQQLSEDQIVKVNKKGVALWTKNQKKLFLSFVVFYFDQMDIYPHKMTWGTFNFMSAYVVTKTKQQCRAFFQRRYKAQNSKLAAIVNKMLIRKGDSKQQLQQALQNQKNFVLKRIQNLEKKSSANIYRFVDQINDQIRQFPKIKTRISLKIEFLNKKQ